MKLSIVLAILAAGVSLALHVGLGLRWGTSFLVAFVGWPVIGTLVTLDDDSPGGWSNPDGRSVPDWLQAPFWGQIVAGLALSAVGFAIDAGWRSSEGLQFWLCAVAAGCLAAVLCTRRWWLYMKGKR